MIPGKKKHMLENSKGKRLLLLIQFFFLTKARMMVLDKAIKQQSNLIMRCDYPSLPCLIILSDIMVKISRYRIFAAAKKKL